MFRYENILSGSGREQVYRTVDWKIKQMSQVRKSAKVLHTFRLLKIPPVRYFVNSTCGFTIDFVKYSLTFDKNMYVVLKKCLKLGLGFSVIRYSDFSLYDELLLFLPLIGPVVA